MLISNTGPLVARGHLGHLGQLEILRNLFSVITVADSVRREVSGSAHKPAADLFADHPWIQVKSDPPMPGIWLATVLDAGEAATITLAAREHPTFVLIDERKGRRIASQISTAFHSLGLLTSSYLPECAA